MLCARKDTFVNFKQLKNPESLAEIRPGIMPVQINLSFVFYTYKGTDKQKQIQNPVNYYDKGVYEVVTATAMRC